MRARRASGASRRTKKKRRRRRETRTSFSASRSNARFFRRTRCVFPGARTSVTSAFASRTSLRPCERDAFGEVGGSAVFGVVSVRWYSGLDATRRRGRRPIAHLQQHAYAVGAAHHEREKRHGVRDEVRASTRPHRVASCSQPETSRSDDDEATPGHGLFSRGHPRALESRVRIFVVGPPPFKTRAARAAAPLKAGRARDASRWTPSSRYVVHIRHVSRGDTAPSSR